MKIYKDTSKALALLLTRLEKQGILTEKDLKVICGEPLQAGRIEYPNSFLEWFNEYPLSGSDNNKKTSFKKVAYDEFRRHDVSEDKGVFDLLMSATRAYKRSNPDGCDFVQRPQNFLKDWERHIPEEEENSDAW